MHEDQIKKQFQKASQILLNSKNIVITTHMNPDGDAIGSALGLYHFAKEIGASPEIIINDEVPYNFQFLNGAENIKQYNEEDHLEQILTADAVFIVDLNDVTRLKSMEKAVTDAKGKKIVIDHHLDPKDFADIFIIDTEASSAGEIIYKFLNSIESNKINASAAEAIYTAIMTDSGNFRFPRTDSELHRIVADLLDLGADPVKIYNEIYAKVPFRKMRLLGIGYTNMKLFFNGNLLLMYLTSDDIQKAEATEDDVEDFVESLLNINGVKVGILITEAIDRSVIRISFRSKGEISVRDIALKFDGGGHFHAAGARVYNSDLPTVRHRILEEFSKVFS
jgi:bifunctional oligoribonuclease and PAP phosphatase NrnA